MKTFILLVLVVCLAYSSGQQDTSATGNDCNNCSPTINIHPCHGNGHSGTSTYDGQCGALPRDCTEVKNRGDTSSGQRLISPQDDGTSFRVYCDMETDGGGWTVFQRREDGSMDFYRNWDEYENGFGNTNSEHWLGNAKIHRLTAQATYELRVDMADFEDNTSYAKYSKFRLGDASNNYTLILGSYSGNAGDSLRHQAGHAFSTKDRDHDATSHQCARTYQGAWWYNACHNSNLNGLYLEGAHDYSYAVGVNWKDWKGNNYSLKHVEMKIRAAT